MDQTYLLYLYCSRSNRKCHTTADPENSKKINISLRLISII